jgi:hypothetical protein
MNHATVNAAFYVSLLVILPIGLLLMILWSRKIIKPLSKSIEKSGVFNLDAASVKTLFFMFPGLVVFIAFSIPVIYFNYLLKQESFCKEMIRRNNLTETHPDLQKKCGSLDIDELLRNSNLEK